MKSAKLSFDFSDNPKLIEALRLYAASEGISLKSAVLMALESYLAHKTENIAVIKLAEQAFSEWENKHDSVYDEL